MRIRRNLLFWALAPLLVVPCFAATTENAALLKDDDPRLNQKISYTADGATLAEVLGQLSQSTGVVMNAGVDNDDWWVRDRKLILSVRDTKLLDVMRELSGILRFHWSRGGDEGKWTYRLWQDNQQRAEEDSLRTSEETAEAQQLRQKRENALADMVNLGSLAASDASGLKSSDPWRYILATEPLGRDVAEFFQAFAEARNAFVQGKEMTVPAAQLTPELQGTVRRIAQSYDGLAQKIGIVEDHAMLLNSMDRLQVTINRRVSGQENILTQSLLGRITIGRGTDILDIPLFDPASPMGRALGAAIVSLQGGASKDTVGQQLQADMKEAVAAEKLAQDSKRDITSDPALRAQLKLFDEPTIAPLTLTLSNVAKKTGLNVISDYFPGDLPNMSSTSKTLGEHLEAVSAAYGSSWEKAGNTLRFRDREWYKKRAREVPQVWIEYWTARGKINGGLQLQDLVEVANLLDEQIDYTVMKNADLVRFGAGEAARNRQILRFYGLLNDSQRKSLATTRLDAGGLNDDQWAALREALATKGAVYAAVEKGSQFLRLTQSGADVVDYQLSYYPGENEPAVTFKVSSGVVYKTADEIPPPPEDMKKF